IVDNTAERLDKDLKGQPEVQIELRMTLGVAYHEMGLWKQMEGTARGTMAMARSIYGEENLALADALAQRGDALMHENRKSESVAVNLQAIEMERKLRGPESLQEAVALYHLSNALSQQPLWAEAEAPARAALAIRRKRLGEEHQ